MKPDADLTPYGIAATIASFLEELDLEDVTIVGNDSGGAMSQVLATRHPERIGRLVLTNCDTHENFPPGPFKALIPLAKMPGGMAIARRAVPDRRHRPRRLQAFHQETDPAGADPLLDGARPQRPRRQTRPQKGDGRDEQALHARGGREAARLRPPGPARLGAGGQGLPAQVGGAPGGRSTERADRRDPGRRAPSSPSTSRSGSPTRSRPSSSDVERHRKMPRFGAFFRYCACFSSDGAAMLVCVM